MPAEFLMPAQFVAVGSVAMLYAAVGHGGATGYIALLSLMGMEPATVATSALMLNILVASISFLTFCRSGQFNLRQALPYIVLSLPLAYIGSRLPLSKHTVAILLGLALLLSALRFLFLPALPKDEEMKLLKSPAPLTAACCGGLLGLFSGIVGIGGGVFLSPLIIFKRWATVKQTAAISAFFIVVNSVSGLIGRSMSGGYKLEEAMTLFPLLMVAAPAAVIGAIYGANRFSSAVLQKLLAAVLLLAAIKLFFV
jgi:uncharacterized membrane protein YfcA